ncbi:MAG TPA: MaoC family dehydratase [bacterium]|nr:MaoC family dehydratase [bacterium]
MAKLMSVDEMKASVGKEVGVTQWFQIDQKRINAFADCTEDHQFIHVDEELAKKGPFGTTIAHGYLTLSLLSYFGAQNALLPAGLKMAVNYGLNKLRFINPVKVNKRIRNRAVLKSVEDKGGGRVLVTTENTVEIEGEDKPAMVAESLAMFFT